MSTQTEERTHALLSPSSAYTWISCKASTAAQLGQPDDSSEYADEGTAAHELAKWCLDASADTTAYMGRIIKVGEREFEVDEEMADAVQLYVDGVRDRIAAYLLAGAKVEALFEQRLSIEHITGEKGAKGTSDCVLIATWPDRAEICVGDLKFGRGVAVVAENNYQGMMYAGAAYEEHSAFHDFDAVTIFIHQPRIAEKPSEWTLTPDELLTWIAETAKPAAEQAMLYVESVDFVPLALSDFNPGEKQCKFCKAKAVCPALAAHVEQSIGADFEALAQAETTSFDVELLGNDRLGIIYESLDLIDGWMKAVRGRIEAELLTGHAVPGVKLVQGRRGARKWSDTNEAEALLKSMRLKQDEMYTFKVISPTQAEKLLAKESPRRWKKAEALVTQADGKPSVAPESDARPALVIAPPADDFEAVTVEDDGGDLV
ncbi:MULTISPECIES: DUF2800 domain-containing protein [unclassified Caballeronia]|uniref:DUF2800 domain-containing protein n=1 Tax=unclassified Caballeronia TaxID=2646786 RepID=UPI002857023C|nr:MULTISPECIES: DUF2800 domain-containing protein [unclassified Caballeronia]MDR5772099.1 DUF2800 domain-containing protein [Caballeronia sp. LZ002]MDR5847533.1 DUF2800 domain-containing protein [Caballeronia sp. LZ003]